MIREYDKSDDYYGIRDIVSLWMFEPDEEKIEKFMNGLNDSETEMYVCSGITLLKGAIAICHREDGIEIIGIGVHPIFQKNGIGRAMVDYVGDKYPDKKITAQTDDDAVDFYRKTGFSVKSLDEMYTGVRRYLCVK